MSRSDAILVSRREAAQLLGISLKLLDFLIARGRIRSCRLGKRVLLSRSWLESFAQKQVEGNSSEDRAADVAGLGVGEGLTA